MDMEFKTIVVMGEPGGAVRDCLAPGSSSGQRTRTRGSSPIVAKRPEARLRCAASR